MKEPPIFKKHEPLTVEQVKLLSSLLKEYNSLEKLAKLFNNETTSNK